MYDVEAHVLKNCEGAEYIYYFNAFHNIIDNNYIPTTISTTIPTTIAITIPITIITTISTIFQLIYQLLFLLKSLQFILMKRQLFFQLKYLQQFQK